MKILEKAELRDLRQWMRRTHGGVTTFLPTDTQVGMIRMALHKHYGAMEIGVNTWIDIGEPVWKTKNRDNTWAPILVKHREGHWLFLTHHLMEDSKRSVSRAKSDIYLEYEPKNIMYVDSFGFTIPKKDYVFSDIGDLMGGKWKLQNT